MEASRDASVSLVLVPLRLGGLRGKQSTPSIWLGGTGEPFMVDERDAARSAGHLPMRA